MIISRAWIINVGSTTYDGKILLKANIGISKKNLMYFPMKTFYSP